MIMTFETEQEKLEALDNFNCLAQEARDRGSWQIAEYWRQEAEKAFHAPILPNKEKTDERAG